jgi:hypothetical protein
MEKLAALLEEEVKKRVASEKKRIREEYHEQFSDYKRNGLKKLIDEHREETQTIKATFQNEFRQMKEDHRQALKKLKEEISEAKMEYSEKARNIHMSYSDYLRVIALNYSIPYKILLRDAPQDDDNTCRGLKKNMSRCNLVAKHDGFCKHHHSQMVRRHTIEMVDDTSSVASVDVESKRLIDFNSVL